MLKHQADRMDLNALKTLGFFYKYGIGVNADRRVALEYFQKSAERGDLCSNYACYCLSETEAQAYGFFGHGI